MEGIWNKITGKDDHHEQQNPPQTVAQGHTQPQAHGNINELRPVATEASTQKVNKEEDSFSFSKIKEALGGRSPGKQAPAPLPAVGVQPTLNAPPNERKESDDWRDKFKDLLDRGATNKREAEEERLRLEREAVEKEISAKEAEEKATVKGKLKDLFTSDAKEAAEHQRLVDEAIQKRREAEEAKRREESFRHKIKDVFDGDDEEKERERQRLAEEAKRNQSFGARVRNIFKDEPEPAPVKKHPWSRTPSPPPKKDWKDKINELAGGGAKAEAKEDHLDKTIDWVQDHVLGKGDQHNESAVEQAKDKQIADAIRHVTGMKKDDDKRH
ncbi:SubName: Full=Uncharacterized protein {ECO:0000313/EMBL:CCA77729.1} [Serendipita indica DSM 11827]|uniref:Uncharacterized protein n=1 Tax=Serendipita indica (strain DSM 11827) TaxID=1109443 RepID=G4U2C0_SERID|nr:SubName: Full=Uncharacterized protein {ECO:0000313/EMBL:CCA77729.1} [Serendipita indica DSM 11827]CCA77729.1 hypothetical protein PIIN_02951 [Serendipita indica DSM 11827]